MYYCNCVIMLSKYIYIRYVQLTLNGIFNSLYTKTNFQLAQEQFIFLSLSYLTRLFYFCVYFSRALFLPLIPNLKGSRIFRFSLFILFGNLPTFQLVERQFKHCSFTVKLKLTLTYTEDMQYKKERLYQNMLLHFL